ncbi:MAG: 4-(cytidine 5'-diphospho)-2-C-methyl-D-erythritol kinase [Clostridium sp.]|nr:4-(cytidine 5'-diphospho)-2-C-methyl-D-erythritol kinase [Clostridium sp.]
MLLKAYGKINISLDVVGKRDDGYHLLKMIMQSIDLYDEINLDKIDSGIEITCNKQYVPTDERNIAYKAAKIFLEKYKIKGGVHIDINKNIPVAAGLAGGSTDAASVLRGLSKLYDVHVSPKKLMKMGLSIGADVPYCIIGQTAICEGIGEKIRKLKPFKNNILVLVKPKFGVSTKEVYKNFDITKVYKHPRTELLIEAMKKGDLEYVSCNMKNLLENVTLQKYPTLRNIKEKMINLGATGAMMSGSGPTIFAFFEDMQKAQNCFLNMKKEYEDTFITRTI